MEVLKYLNGLLKHCWYEQALNKLSEEFGIKVSVNEKYPELVCLNYDQINSPKLHPIVKECRSLVLSIPVYDFGVPQPYLEEDFKVVSRSFDRFFNLGEEQNKEYDITQMTAYEKIDGSLVSVFHYNGEWLYRTRSMIMPDESLTINGTTTTWKDLIEGCLGDVCEFLLEEKTYIFEVVSPENRVVTRYPDKSAYLLAVRDNVSGDYVDFHGEIDFLTYLKSFNIKLPKIYLFDTLDHCLQSAKDLPELQEGYVMYNENGIPCVKVKNPAYVAAHHLRGEGVLSGKRIMDLIFMNEQDEYLSIFPEDKERFEPYLKAFDKAHYDFYWNVELHMDKESQKEFALAVKNTPAAGLLFQSRQKPNLTFSELFDNLTTPAKYRLVESYL